MKHSQPVNHCSYQVGGDQVFYPTMWVCNHMEADVHAGSEPWAACHPRGLHQAGGGLPARHHLHRCAEAPPHTPLLLRPQGPDRPQWQHPCWYHRGHGHHPPHWVWFLPMQSCWYTGEKVGERRGCVERGRRVGGGGGGVKERILFQN